MYDKERRGEKNNAIEIITGDEWVQLSARQIREIKVVQGNTDECFTRRVTDISLVGRIADRLIIVITWKVEK